MNKQKTKVIFRVFKNSDGALIALFPELPGSYEPHMCDSYMHDGQHAKADVKGVINGSRAATPLEYAALHRELSSAPYFYNLDVKVRESTVMRETRYAALKRFK